MAEAVRKHQAPESAAPADVDDRPIVEAVGPFAFAEGLESPARQLQAQLLQRVEPDGVGKYPARYVTATVITVCLAFWLSLYLFVSSLIA